MRILFMGSGDVACPALEKVLAHPDYAVVAVVAQPDKPKGRNRKVAPCAAKAFAEEKGVPVMTPDRIGRPEAVDEIKALAPDVIVVVAYGQYIPSNILAIPSLGAINLHPSLLPKYRGASPVQWALANGETVTGVTILYVSKEMDAGDILAQRSVPIDDGDTAQTLTSRLAEDGADLLLEVLLSLRNGTALRAPQNHDAATIVYKLEKEDGRIDWTSPAVDIRNRIRGFFPWPGCFTFVKGKMLKVLKAEVVDESTDAEPGTLARCDAQGPVVATGRGLLRLLDVQPEGKSAMSGAAFLCGHPLPGGTRLV